MELGKLKLFFFEEQHKESGLLQELCKQESYSDSLISLLSAVDPGIEVTLQPSFDSEVIVYTLCTKEGFEITGHVSFDPRGEKALEIVKMVNSIADTVISYDPYPQLIKVGGRVYSIAKAAGQKLSEEAFTALKNLLENGCDDDGLLKALALTVEDKYSKAS